jgi:DNA polymerase III alpha subunit
MKKMAQADVGRSVDLPRNKGRRVRVAGLVAAGRYAYTEEGLEMQFITLEDEWGLMEATRFPRTCRLIRRLKLGPYVVVGVVEEQFGVFTLTADAVLIGWTGSARPTNGADRRLARRRRPRAGRAPGGPAVA